MHIMNRFFDRLSEEGIKYAHFKSNSNLDYSFNNTGDFDVIVDPLRQEDVYKILLSLHAKQMSTTNEKHYPGVDNWLFLNEETGRIHHLHLHYKLMSGKPYVKDYEIPWRDLLLETRVYDDSWNIYITDPNLELLLLSVRTVIKSHFSDYLKAFIGLYRTHQSLQSEREILFTQVSEEKMGYFLKRLFASESIEELKEIVLSEKIDSRQFRKLTGIVRREFAIFRRYSGIKAASISLFRTFRYYWNRLLNKCGCLVMLRKTSMSKGAIIAIVGVDGSGKSTTSRQIYKWLSKQFDCATLYMGMGDGKTTLLVKILKKGRKLAGISDGTGPSINSNKYRKKDPVSFRKNPKFFLRKRLLVSSLYSTVKANNRKMKQMNRYRINGGITILDRYPQIELPNKNDGPKIGAYRDVIKADRIISRLEAKETKYMSIVKSIKPDIVFRLNISAEESMRRKDDQNDISIVQGKIDDLKSIHYQGARIIDIDAMQPYEDELKEIKRYIWNFL